MAKYFSVQLIIQGAQISTVFNPEYEQVINLDGYDRIQKYYLQPGDYETDEEGDDDDEFDDEFD